MEQPENYIGNHNPEDEAEYYALLGIELESEEMVEDEVVEVDWIAMARDAYTTSDDYFKANLTKQIEKNLSLFQSKHPSGSKYHSEAYKYRSKIFRPKTRSAIFRREASAAAAYFTTSDVVNCFAENPADKYAVIGAEIASDLLNYRLEHTIPWFLTAMGAYQDAMVQGVCISRQEWIYEERLVDLGDGTYTFEPSKDTPGITLIPVENFRFDPAANWLDPVGTSPYLIELIPMHVSKVRERMRNPDPKTGQPPWNELEEEQIRSGTQTGRNDTVRQQREGKRQDSTDVQNKVADYEIVWVHRNIIRYEGDDWLYYTLGADHLLSEPVLLEDAYPQGRPYVVGYCNIETHKGHPSGQPEIGEGLQTEANDIANQRLDNIKLALNRRNFARRGANVDWRALVNSVPGGVVLVDDINKDVRTEAPPDVTGSSYQEQDRISNDFDDIMGVFSQSSVLGNRKLNETVGGMNMLSQDANALNEYQLRIFTETWTEKVLKQLLDLERIYESDPVVLGIVAREGMTADQVLQILQEPMTVRVAVGFGATNPQMRVERLAMALNTLGQFAPQLVQQRLDTDEVTTEIFGALGFRDGSRFFKAEDDEQLDPQQMAAQMQEMQGLVQQLQQQLQTKQIEQQGRIQVEQIRQQGAVERERIKADLTREIKQLEQQVDYIDQQIKAEQNDIKRGELMIQRDAFTLQKQIKELEFSMQERDRMSDVLMRDKYGMAPGIDDQPGRG